MIKVMYNEPELKDIIEGIIGKNFFIFCNDIIQQVLAELTLPARLMNEMTILLLPHDDQTLGLAYKPIHSIKLKIQDTLEDNEKTLIHETIHIFRPSWSEKTVEKLTNKIHRTNTKEIFI